MLMSIVPDKEARKSIVNAVNGIETGKVGSGLIFPGVGRADTGFQGNEQETNERLGSARTSTT